MVGRWGMSEAHRPGVGAARPERRADAVPGRRRRPSEHTRELVDDGGPPDRRGVLRARRSTSSSEHRDQLEALTRALLERETLDEADAYRIAGIEREPVPDPAPAT